MTIVISLILIFIENSLPLNGILMGVILPFISFIIGKRRNPIFVFLAWLLFSLQTDKYSYNFLILTLFSVVNYLLFHYVEYNRKSILYLVPLDIALYILVVFNTIFYGIDIVYLIINIVSFFILNYFYSSRKNKRKVDET
ncbi:hypothetical protein HMPREF9093_00657 [Fusobacterium sp. oral taxon 370 str. F0437]|uniref:hypothetical protein n=1 Tax=unclassified Fusobacterium TaxID=2648384 RepID=UPI000234B011|nr:hypothetical protein [uncultured Fusobacterium sp.]EHI79055.1 hypothetical protein HMPREF9093_00657 [Fusobacterium sp. oral taxon 370 str. F0437]